MAGVSIWDLKDQIDKKKKLEGENLEIKKQKFRGRIYIYIYNLISFLGVIVQMWFNIFLKLLQMVFE
jgi:hypothetical protein